MHRTLITLALALAACDDANVEGTVDGREVNGARSAIWDEAEVDIPFVGSYSLTTVVLTDFSDSCEVINAFADADEDSDDCEELCAAYIAVVDEFGLDPEEHWALSMSANTSDGAIGDFEYEDIPAEEQFAASFSFLRGEDLADAATCEDACEDNELLGDASDTELGEDGVLTLDEVNDGDLPGEFRIEFGGADVLEGSFDAEPCDLD